MCTSMCFGKTCHNTTIKLAVFTLSSFNLSIRLRVCLDHFGKKKLKENLANLEY